MTQVNAIIGGYAALVERYRRILRYTYVCKLGHAHSHVIGWTWRQRSIFRTTATYCWFTYLLTYFRFIYLFTYFRFTYFRLNIYSFIYLFIYITVAQHCYNGDVSFLWEKWKIWPPVKLKPLNRLTHNLSGLITSTSWTFVPNLVKFR